MLRVCSILVAAAATLSAAPCTSATSTCTERLPLGPEGRYSIVYRSFPLKEKNAKIERALIVIHGAGRNANDYFSSALAGALIAGALEDTVVVSPRIASNTGQGCTDVLDPGEISWICGGPNDWRRGGAAEGISDIYTYTFVDEIIRTLTRRDVFPNLKTIVVTGHSAGGQFTNRYAAASTVDVKLPIRYVVSNPSSYLYLDAARPTNAGSCKPDGTCEGEFRVASDNGACADYNNWHYGMEQRSGYAAAADVEVLRKQLIARDVTYLLGALDTLPLFGFDSSCSAMAQGPTRYARGLAYNAYLRSKYGASHKLVSVPACGHNGRCIYTSDEALPLIFPR